MAGKWNLEVLINPRSRLRVNGSPNVASSEDSQLLNDTVQKRIFEAFSLDISTGILHLATKELKHRLPDDLNFLKDNGQLFLTKCCAIHDLESQRESLNLPPPMSELKALVENCPPIRGSEYLTTETLALIWEDLRIHFQKAINQFDGTVEEYLHTLNPAWHLVGRVCFHLAENKHDPDYPFAFLASYTSRLAANGEVRHISLKKALEGSIRDEKKSSQLLKLLDPISRASAASEFIRGLLDSGELYETLAWGPDESYRFLKEVALYESCGIIVRIPDWWRPAKAPRPEINISVGNKPPAGVGLNSLVNFDITMSIGGESLNATEIRELLSSSQGLVSIRGKWVEADGGKLKEILEYWQYIKNSAAKEGLSFAKSLRMIAGAVALDTNDGPKPLLEDQVYWSKVTAGDWMAETLSKLRSPEALPAINQKIGLEATLRPYQDLGVRWLCLLHELKLGACLADDMGLGKTIQIIALLLVLKAKKQSGTSLLIAPASLLSNWLAEIHKFAPTLKVTAIHPSFVNGNFTASDFQKQVAGTDLAITTYGMAQRHSWLEEQDWKILILDEAQAIKNPKNKQTLAIKKIQAEQRIILTGTPVENRISDLWSLFDFACPGLLGSSQIFSKFLKTEKNPYQAIKNLIRPYILRRLKTDRQIIADLPEKIELDSYCYLTKEQAGLYQKSVMELEKQIVEVEGIKRRGLVLAFLMRLKQICNHPSQWLGDGQYNANASGKFNRLKELCEEIALKQEKVLLFTQFREMTAPLAEFIATLFNQRGLILHGGTPIKERKEAVNAFQSEDGPPFFILSLKAGGAGLNLTAASHVIHFDRWWNPAVENQATDRAFRIGQKKNVLVHKFICKGTIEEKIHKIINDKKAMASSLVDQNTEAILTELSNDELLKLVALDIRHLGE